MPGMEFGQQNTLNTNTHPESENVNVIWKIASNASVQRIASTWQPLAHWMQHYFAAEC